MHGHPGERAHRARWSRPTAAARAAVRQEPAGEGEGKKNDGNYDGFAVTTTISSLVRICCRGADPDVLSPIVISRDGSDNVEIKLCMQQNPAL